MKRIDISGKKFNKLTVLEYMYTTSRGRTYWRSRCDCGNIVIAESYNIKRGNVKSCGCARKIDLTGQKFGRLKVIKFSHIKNGGACWKCQCECGNTKVVSSDKLKRKRKATVSCGCYKKEQATKHGKYRIPEYKIWIGIKQRCYDKNIYQYKDYGARGIRVCERWINSFENFFADMGKRPSPKYSIDRIDNNGDYTPENCRWATPRQQHRNKRSNRLITFNNKTKTIAEWSEIVNITQSAIHSRFKRGWSTENTLTLPSKGCKK